jgi:spore cortex formation protein SpoVR/YcgB (stage V sporulation)
LDDRDLPRLEEAIGKIWDKARSMGLDPFPTHFEIVPATILYEFGAYLLPGRFSHWTHGKAWYPNGSQKQSRPCARTGQRGRLRYPAGSSGRIWRSETPVSPAPGSRR